jgi:hypothetical protein
MADASINSNRAAALVALLLGWTVLICGSLPLGAGDFFWQLRVGELELAGEFPTTDTFSYTVEGARWNNHEWLFELLLALGYRGFGWWGLRMLALLAPAAVVAGVVAMLWRRSGAALAVFTGAVALLLVRYKFIPAPQTVSMALFLLAVPLFLRKQTTARALAAAGYLALWGNLTAEAWLFVPFLLVDQGLRLVEDPTQRTRRAALLALTCLAPALNPPWSSSLEYVLGGSLINREVNAEFTSLFESTATLSLWAKSLALVVCVAFVAWSAVTLRARRDVKTVRKVAIGLLAVALAVLFERNVWLLVIPAARLALELSSRRPLSWVALAAAPLLMVAATGGVPWTPAVAARFFAPTYWSQGLDPQVVPIGCGEQLAKLFQPGQHVFSRRIWSNYFLWAAPEQKVFIDGRNREYPLEVFQAMNEVLQGGPGASAILQQTYTQLVVAPPDWSAPLGWRKRWEDSLCAVFEPAPR